jgi:hypothetical protein
MKNDDLFAAKCAFLKERYVELQNHLVAFAQSATDSEPFPEPLAKELDVSNLKGFSPLLEALNSYVNGKKDFKERLFEKQVNLLLSDSTPDIESLRDPLIDPGYAFADEWDASNDEKIGFKAEFFAVLWFFLKSRGADPQVDFALTKALFQLGKVIGRLERDGCMRRDQTSSAGRTKHKGYITYEEVVQTAKDVVETFKGLGIKPQKESVKRAVRDRFLKSESEKKNPKVVYGPDQIKNILKDEWADIL